MTNQENPLHGSTKAEEKLSRRELDVIYIVSEREYQKQIGKIEAFGEKTEEDRYLLIFPNSAFLWLLDSALRADEDSLTCIRRALLIKDELERRGFGDNSIVNLINPGKDIQPMPIEFSW